MSLYGTEILKFSKMIKQKRVDFNKKLFLTVEAIRDISWLCDNICTNTQYILTPPVDIVSETDSSQKNQEVMIHVLNLEEKQVKIGHMKEKKISHQFS